jgi:superfamily II DNA or RNA helicase
MNELIPYLHNQITVPVPPPPFPDDQDQQESGAGESIEVLPPEVLSFDQMITKKDITDEEGRVKGTKLSVSLTNFLKQYGGSLLEEGAKIHPSVYQEGTVCSEVEKTIAQLKRKPIGKQTDCIAAICRLFENPLERAAILNGYMGTGKTFMGLAIAYHLHRQGLSRCLVLSPPHLVYKWRREIINTVPDAKVTILNGSDTLRKLIDLHLRASLNISPQHPEFYVLGRVRMRTGHHWRPAYILKWIRSKEYGERFKAVACPRCFSFHVHDGDDHPISMARADDYFKAVDKQIRCKKCKEPLFTMVHPRQSESPEKTIIRGLLKIPTIGQKTAERLLADFGHEILTQSLDKNVYDFINLQNADGFVFSDRQQLRMERAIGHLEFALGQGGYQPSEFIKRFLPKHFFGTLLIDEGHEYKNGGSAQGQAMGVVSSTAKKVVLLTGTLMGGYAADLFYLLFRLNPRRMIKNGFKLRNVSLFNKGYGIEKKTYTNYADWDEGKSFVQSKGDKYSVRVSSLPGFSPEGILRFVLPITVFMKLKDLGEGALPPYHEFFRLIEMSEPMRQAYDSLSGNLKQALRQALRQGDHSLMGSVLNALLAYPDCAFRPEKVYHPHKRELLASVEAVLADDQPSPKEQELIDHCLEEKQKGRSVLVYTIYTDKRDTTARLKFLLSKRGLRVSVLKSSVKAEDREAWIMDQVDQGLDVLITNPELVKTGLDLLGFPSIWFMQTGYNLYTLLQAACRSLRLGQTEPVETGFAGYKGTAQEAALTLMARKIAVAQSVSGDVPDSALDILNSSMESMEVELAKQILEQAA